MPYPQNDGSYLNEAITDNCLNQQTMQQLNALSGCRTAASCLPNEKKKRWSSHGARGKHYTHTFHIVGGCMATFQDFRWHIWPSNYEPKIGYYLWLLCLAKSHQLNKSLKRTEAFNFNLAVQPINLFSD
jgi:hypothetical protein